MTEKKKFIQPEIELITFNGEYIQLADTVSTSGGSFSTTNIFGTNVWGEDN